MDHDTLPSGGLKLNNRTELQDNIKMNFYKVDP
jgi:hypothetical protein